MPPERPTLAQQIALFIARGVAWFGRRVFWRWPVRATTKLWADVIDRPVEGLIVAGPITAFVVGIFVIAHGAHAGYWGKSLRTAWSNEDVSRRGVATGRQVLEEHDAAEPKKWGHQAHPRKEFKRWEADREGIEDAIDEVKAGVPSMFSLLPPTQDWPEGLWHWSFVYRVHHVLFRTVYSWPIVAWLVGGLVVAWRKSQRRRRWQWRRAWNRQDGDQVLLGLTDDGRSRMLSQRVRTQHLLVCGTTGSGKTEALKHLIRADILAGRGVLVIDMKGERALSEAVAVACAEARRTDDFRFFSLEGPSHTYNPLAWGSPGAIRDRLIASCVWSHEQPYYQERAKAVSLRLFETMARKGGTLTFEDVHHPLTSKEALSLLSRWATPATQIAFEETLAKWDDFTRDTSGFLDNVSEFVSERFRDRLCDANPDILLPEAHARRQVVHFELNSQLFPVAARTIARFLLEDMKALGGALGQKPSDQHDFHVYIDEAGRAIYREFEKFITQCRSAGIALTLATQSPLDFDTEEGKFAHAVLQNTGTKLILRQLNPESAALCADLGGTYTTMERTRQLADQGLLGIGETGVYSEREVNKYFAHPDAIKTLPTGRAFLVEAAGGRSLVQMVPPWPRPAWRFEVPKIAKRAQGPNGPPLDFARLVAEERAKKQSAGAKRAPKADEEGAPLAGPALEQKEEATPPAMSSPVVSRERDTLVDAAAQEPPKAAKRIMRPGARKAPASGKKG